MLKLARLFALIEVRRTLRRVALEIGLVAGAGFVATVAVIFGLVALQAWLALRYGSVEANLFIAAGLAVLSLAMLAAVAILKSVWRRKRRRRLAANIARAAVVPALGVAAAERGVKRTRRRMRDNIVPLGLAALAFGFIAGRTGGRS